DLGEQHQGEPDGHGGQPGAVEPPGQQQGGQQGDQGADPVGDMDGGPALAVEHAAQVVGANLLEDVEPGSKVHFRPPLAMTGRQVDTGDRRIIAAGPAAQGDLRNDNDQHRPGQRAQGGQADVCREAPGQAQGQQEEQAQGGEATEQVG